MFPFSTNCFPLEQRAGTFGDGSVDNLQRISESWKCFPCSKDCSNTSSTWKNDLRTQIYKDRTVQIYKDRTFKDRTVFNELPRDIRCMAGTSESRLSRLL